jgi:predicted CoA-binding protein
MQQQFITEFWKGKRFAIVGVSRFHRKFGNSLYREMKKRKYEVYPVNRKGGEVEGNQIFTDLETLPQPIDGVIVTVPPHEAKHVVAQCAELGIRHVWLQQGAESEDVIRFCDEHSINVVHHECAMMYVEPRRFPHSAHYWVHHLFGRVGKN